MSATVDPLDVVIVGGSLAGLMNGIVLHRLGHNVRILEKSNTSQRENQAAGITSGPNVKEFLDKYDLSKEPLSMYCDEFRILSRDGSLKRAINFPRQLTSWDALYHRLRANFDGLESAYSFEDLSKELSAFKGTALYELGKAITAVSAHDDGVTVRWQSVDANTELPTAGAGQSGTIEADLVIAADGASSIVKRSLELDATQPTYAGYVAWRGTVPENDVEPHIRDQFQGHICSFGDQGEYILVYHIPGALGSLEPGRRLLNFVWYTPLSQARLPSIMTDIRGVPHRRTIPSGLLQPSVWADQRKHAQSVLSPQFLTLINSVPKPFLQAIDESSGSRAVLAEGRVLLVGEALAVLRPHTAQGVDRIAQAALWLGEVGEGKSGLKGWEGRVVKEARWTKWRSKTFGIFMMNGLVRSLPLFFALGVIGVWNWVVGKMSGVVYGEGELGLRGKRTKKSD